MKKILFICTGNTCRSPMAEVVLSKLCAERNIPVLAGSAGLCTLTGLPAAENSRKAAQTEGLSLESFTSTSIEDIRFEDWDIFAVMTSEHKSVLESFGVAPHKIFVLAESRGGISDPYGGSEGRYLLCLQEIKAALEEFICSFDDASIKILDKKYTADIQSIDKESFSHPWSEDTVSNLLSSDNACVLGAFCSTELVGYVALEWVLDEGNLTNLAVRPSYRRQGIAEKLTRALIACAKDRKLAFVTLEVRASNTPAIALYEKLGFVQVGKRPRYYSKPLDDALLMTLDL